MAYCTPADMAAVATGGWNELAQRTAQDRRVIGATLQSVCAGEPPALDAETLALAQSAAARLRELCEQVTNFANTFIAVRYSTPLDADTVRTSDLSTVCATLALVRLYGLAATDDVRKSAAWATDYLKSVQRGEASLGRQQVQGNDPVTASVFSGRAVTDLDLVGY